MKTTLSFLLFSFAAAAFAGDVALPAPTRTGGLPLADALAARSSHRDFSSEPLSDQALSDLLWAANGFNRPDEKKRTAPSAMNRQEIDLYVLRADGAFLYDAAAGSLRQVSADDLRGLTGRPGSPENFALAAPVSILYVADYARQGMQARPEDAARCAAVDCGFIGQNIYLHCAAAGLHAVFVASIKPAELSAALALPETSVPLFAHVVGKPADASAAAETPKTDKTPVMKIDDLLSSAGAFFLATADGDQPKLRPLGAHHVVDGALWLGVGEFKNVYRQLAANPKFELVALQPDGGTWLRCTGRAVFAEGAERERLEEVFLEASPGLRKVYDKKPGHRMMCFRLADVRAELIPLMPPGEILLDETGAEPSAK